jgi:hypothetical protein
VAAADPHTGYQKESEKGAASGYASLDAGTKVPTVQLGGAGADATKFLRGDQSWQAAGGTLVVQEQDVTVVAAATTLDFGNEFGVVDEGAGEARIDADFGTIAGTFAEGNHTHAGSTWTVGTATLDFGAFPGKTDASIAVTGQAGIIAGSYLTAHIRPVATADHSADEHMLETFKVFAGNIVPGTGFTIYGFNTSELHQENVGLGGYQSLSSVDAGGVQASPGQFRDRLGGSRQPPLTTNQGTFIYGTWSIGWAWT